MELTREEIKNRLGRLRRLIEWKIVNVPTGTHEKEVDTGTMNAIEFIEKKTSLLYTVGEVRLANKLWKEFKQFVTGSMPAEVDKEADI